VGARTRRLGDLVGSRKASGGFNRHADRLAAMIAGGTPPDVTHLISLDSAIMGGQGLLEDLTPYFDREGVQPGNYFVPPIAKAIDWGDGATYVLPLTVHPNNVYYNVEHFNEAGLATPNELAENGGWTWNTYVEAARRLTRFGPDGAMQRGGSWGEVSMTQWAPLVWQLGGELFDRTVFPTRATFDTPEAREAFSYYADLWTTHQVVPSFADRAAQPGLWFVAGNASMTMNPASFIGRMRREEVPFEWDVAPMPTGPQGTVYTNLTMNNFQIPRDSKNKEAAWKFIKFVSLREENVRHIMQVTGRPPAMGQMFGEYVESLGSVLAHGESIIDMLLVAREIVVSEHLGEINRIINPIARQVFDGNRSPSDGLAEMHERINALLQE